MQSVKPEETIARRSPLSEEQKKLGARFGRMDGSEVVLSYSMPADEYRLVRDQVGLVDLSHCGIIKVSGSEAERFLNGLVTNDVKTLSKGHGMQAAFLTGHGKVKALCRILALGYSYLILNDPQTHDKVYKYVFPFSYAGDFKVEDVSAQYAILSIQGPRALLVMKEVSFEPVSSMDEHQWNDAIVAGHEVMIIKASLAGLAGYDILAPVEAAADVWDFILLKGGFHGIRPFGLEALDLLRFEAGVPKYGIDIDESNMMLEPGLPDAVSFTKGCYTGQEAVAMATYRGHVSKKLSGLAIEGDTIPARGDKVLSQGREVGAVTSAMRSETLGQVIAMAYVKYGFFEPGSSVEIQNEQGLLRASIVEMPFRGTKEES
ncbi:MAG: aminomethyltransferase family protein [Acidobacteriota bacterium]